MLVNQDYVDNTLGSVGAQTDDEADDVVQVLAGRGLDVRGTGILKAKGSQREVSDIMGNVVANYKAALTRAEKNKVNLATLKWARENEYFHGLFKEIKPKIIGQTFKKAGEPRGFIKGQINDPQVLHIREKGKAVYLKINDPRLAEVLKGVNRQKLDGVMRIVGSITRFYSGVHTRFNPEFALPNKIRDLQETAIYLASKNEIGFKKTAKMVLKDLKQENTKAVLDFFRGKDTSLAKLYNQMRLDGGTTGGMSLSTKSVVDLDIRQQTFQCCWLFFYG